MIDLLQHGSPSLIDLLSPAIWQRLEALGKVERYRDRQLIHARGDDKPGISVVLEGRVMIGIQGSDGTFLQTSIMGRGQCFGEFTLFAGLPRTHDISAIGAASVLQVGGKAFMALFNAEPEVSKALLTVSVYRTHGLLEFLDDLRRLPLPVHIAKFLLAIATPDVDSPVIRCNQEDLAFTFGVSRISIGKALKTLEGEGLLRLGYGNVTLIDRGRLGDWLDRRRPVAALVTRS